MNENNGIVNYSWDPQIALARIVATIGVIALHVSAPYYGGYIYGGIVNDKNFPAFIFDATFRCSVPLFFMISGALIIGRDKSAYRAFLRILKILSPFIGWALIYFIDSGAKIDLSFVRRVLTGDTGGGITSGSYIRLLGCMRYRQL